MKAQLTINLPDGWELAEPEARRPRFGDALLLPDGVAYEVREGDRWSSTYPILRRIRSEYVNVRMKRAMAEQITRNGPVEMVAICREALAAADKEV